MWEPHLSLLLLKGNVEVLSAYQEWSSWAGGAGLVGHRHGGEHGLCFVLEEPGKAESYCRR